MLIFLFSKTTFLKPFQVQQELSSTFARLCQLADETTSEMKDDIKRIDAELAAMAENAARSKVSKHLVTLWFAKGLDCYSYVPSEDISGESSSVSE